MHYYQKHIGDYRKDTPHLTMLEHGAYNQLIDWYYLDEGHLPLDHKELFRKLPARTKAEKNAVENVLRDFFQKKADGYHHNRCDTELSRIYEKSEKAREAANKRWERNADAMQTHSERNADGMLPINPLPINPIPKKSTAARFGEFWDSYPKGHKQSKKGALSKWKAKRLDDKADLILADVAKRISEDDRWTEGFIPDAVVYINQERWDGDIYKDPKKSGGVAINVPDLIADDLKNIREMAAEGQQLYANGKKITVDDNQFIDENGATRGIYAFLKTGGIINTGVTI